MKYLDPENQGLISSLRSVNAVNLKKHRAKRIYPSKFDSAAFDRLRP